MDYLEAGLKELGVEGPEKKAKLEQYLSEVVRFNPLYGLVSGSDRDEIIIRHILDSLAPWKHLARELSVLSMTASMSASVTASMAASVTASMSAPAPAGREIADIGSGAGFPGIPLALVIEDCRFLLVEKMAKRVRFLQNVKAVLRLRNVAVIEGEAEQAVRDGMRADIVICRGFSEINGKVIGLFSRLLKPGGTMAFYKGKREKIDREIASCEHAAPPNIAIERYAPPFLHEERHLVIIKGNAPA